MSIHVGVDVANSRDEVRFVVSKNGGKTVTIYESREQFENEVEKDFGIKVVIL